MSRYLYSLALLAGSLLSYLMLPVRAQTGTLDPAASIAEVTTAQTPEGTAADLRLTPRVFADFNTPRSGDNERAFTQLNGFIPLFQTPGSSVTFLNTSARVDSGGNWGGSLSLGHRWQLQEMLLGGYLSYDIRDTDNATFNQLGLGLELFGDTWDAHLNGYIPVGDTRTQTGDGAATQVLDAFFQSNQLSFTTGIEALSEEALGGVDLEGGLRIGDFGSAGTLWSYGKLYYLDDTVGIGGRLDYRLANNFRSGLGLQTDGIFGTRVFFSMGVGFGGAPTSAGDETVLWARAAEFLTRNSGIAVERENIVIEGATEVAINPDTGEPWFFNHVVDGDSGDGSFENPFGAIADATSTVSTDGNGIIYVTGGGTLTGPFDIPGGVQLLSSGPEQFIPVDSDSVSQVQLPSSGSGDFPILGSTVNLASSTVGPSVLSGFDIQSGSGDGVSADNSLGEIVIRDNRVTAPENGVAVSAITASEAGGVTVTNNTINAGDDGVDFGLFDSTLTGDVTVSGNTIEASEDAVDFELYDSTLTGDIVVSGNTLNASEDGVDVYFYNSTLSGEVVVSSNTIEADRVGVVLENYSYSELTQGATISGNTINAQAAGVVVVNDYYSRIAGVTISDNPSIQVTGGGTVPGVGNAAAGIVVANDEYSTITNGVTISGNGPIQVSADSMTSTIGILVLNQNSQIDGNVVIENTESIQVSGGDTNVAALSTGDVSGIGTAAVSVVNLTTNDFPAESTISGDVTISGNADIDSSEYGMIVANAANYSYDATITGNLTIDTNTITAVDDGVLVLNAGIVTGGNAVIGDSVIISGNTITSTGDDGIDFTNSDVLGTGTVTQDVIFTPNTINAAGDDIKCTNTGTIGGSVPPEC
ncbi:MAG: hypothetical protein AAFR15_01090 [Cyanobacteria bacterium J06627_15]